MKINFKRKYEDDGVRWSVVLVDFLTYLSKKYGYTIDAFDLQALPEMIQQDRLAELVNSKHSIEANRAFTSQVVTTMRAKQRANSYRKVKKECWKAMDIFDKEKD